MYGACDLSRFLIIVKTGSTPTLYTISDFFSILHRITLRLVCIPRTHSEFCTDPESAPWLRTPSSVQHPDPNTHSKCEAHFGVLEGPF